MPRFLAASIFHHISTSIQATWLQKAVAPCNNLRRMMSTISKSELDELAKAKIIPVLSRSLPSSLDSSRCHTLATKMWTSLSKKDKKLIAVALKQHSTNKEPSAKDVTEKLDVNSPAQAPAPTPDLKCWVDASTVTHYTTIVAGRHTAIFRYLGEQDHSDRQCIDWREVVALELAARAAFALGYSGSRVQVYSQNKSAIRIFNSAEAPEENSSESMLRLRSLLKDTKINMTCVEVTPEDNLARSFSKGMVNVGYTKMPCDIQLPVVLMPLIIKV